MRVQGVSKAFGTRELFTNVTFEIRPKEKVGFVGANGTGKTTLMRMLLGKEELDAGTISFEEGARIGYVEQQADFTQDTLEAELRLAFADVLALKERKEQMEKVLQENASESALAAYARVVEAFERLSGYDFESRLQRIAFGLGFSAADLKKDVHAFSGGQKTRISLAKALVREPDYLFLDEPTNHLDIERIEWLENFLQEYRGSVLIISHDRFFLDRVISHVLDLDHQKVTMYEGNYTKYLKVKEEREASLLSAYEKQQAFIKKQEEYIRRYRAGIKAKQARGREGRLKRMERIVLPSKDQAFNHFAFHPPALSAERVADFEDVCAGYPQHEVLAGITLSVRRGDGLAIIGPNGAGKTTLLKVLLGEIEPTAGRVKIGSRVKVGYFSQQHEGLNPIHTLLEELNDSFGLDEETARKYLGAFLFRGDTVFRHISELSGGEAARLAFLKLLLTGANFLVLDEPTNHLDIPAKEAVETALMSFPATFIVVSHDRYFLDKVANRVAELEDGKLTLYEGNYSYSREKKAELEAVETKATPVKKVTKVVAPKKNLSSQPHASVKSTNAENYPLPPASTEKREMLLARAEAEIAMAEAELKGIERQMNDPALQGDPQKSVEIARLYAEKEAEIQRRYEHWEALAL